MKLKRVLAWYKTVRRAKRRQRNDAIVHAYRHGSEISVMMERSESAAKLEIALEATIDHTLYYNLHPDVAAAGASASIHYINHGIKDGRALLNDSIGGQIMAREWIGDKR